MLMMSGKKSNISNKFMMQKRNNILVIDDDKLMRVSLKSLLEENGYPVYTVSSGDEAVQTLDKNSVDLILFDLRLYDDRELSLVNKIKEASPDTIILIMIEQNKIKTVINTLCLDTVDYMLKPFDPDYLKKTVEKPFTSSNWNRALKNHW